MIMTYAKDDDESFLMACLDDKVISDLTRCEPFKSTPWAHYTLLLYLYIIIIITHTTQTRATCVCISLRPFYGDEYEIRLRRK